MANNRPMPITGEDWFKDTTKRITRLERRTGNMLTPDLLGPGIASLAVQIIDWNSLEATFNGFYYSNAGLAINSPDPQVSWTGQTIAKDDGSGMQQVWGTDNPIYWVRNYAPNPEPGGQPVFGPWQRFASDDGSIPDSVIRTQWEDADAYTLTADDVADGSFTFTLTYVPILESVQAAWGGVIQAPTEYYMNFTTATVVWPLIGFEAVGDVFWFHYTHDRVHAPTPPEPEPEPGTCGSWEAGLPEGWERLGHDGSGEVLDYLDLPGIHVTLDDGQGYYFPAPAGDFDFEVEFYPGGTSRMHGPVAFDLAGPGVGATFYDTPGNGLYITGLNSDQEYSGVSEVLPSSIGGGPHLIRLSHRSGDYTGSYSLDGGDTWSAETPVMTGGTLEYVGFLAWYAYAGIEVTILSACLSEPDEPPPEPTEGTLLANGTYTDPGGAGTSTATGAVPIGDGSDDTYITFPQGAHNTTVGIELLTGPAATGFTLHLRMRVLVSDATGFAGQGEVFLNGAAGATSEIAGFSDGSGSGYAFALPAGVATGTVEFTVPLNLGPWPSVTVADVEEALRDGCYLQFNAWSWLGGSFTPTFRVYDAWITYTTEGGEEPPPDPVGPGPYVTPLAAKAVHESYGICQHVNFQSDNIHAGATNQAAIMERYGDMHVHQMRSMYNPNGSAAFAAAIAGLRDTGMKWNALVAARKDDGSIEPSEATIRARITKMATDHADVIGWIEGINEPNEPSDPDWVDEVLYAQWVIWDEWSQHPELAHVKVLSPSMHDTRLDASDGAHWEMFANGEVTAGGETYLGKDLCHMASVHSYPAGSLPDTNRADRVQWVYDAFGDDFPIKFTEWGYTNAVGEPRVGGHKVTNEAAAAAYSAQAILDFANNGWELMQYEMMDDPNAAHNDTEKNFGQWRVTSLTGAPDSTWTAKPSVAAITTVLSALADPGEDYLTGDVTLDLSDVPAGVRTCVTQKRDGTTTLWLWRHTQMWNPTTEAPISAGTVSAPVTDVAGLRNITVGVAPVAVNVRLEP